MVSVIRSFFVPCLLFLSLVSCGAGTVEVPDLAGQTSDDAERFLSDEGLDTSIEVVEKSGVVNGEVIETVPEANETVEKGSEITLYVGQGVEVPRVVGYDYSIAETILINAGFIPLIIAERDNSLGMYSEGEVISQGHEASANGQGFSDFADPGSRIELLVAKAPSHTIFGVFTLFADWGGTASDCYGLGGFDDIERNLPTVLRDAQTGLILGSTNLSAGTGTYGSSVTSKECTFTWLMEDVPEVDFYEIEIGDRGEVLYSLSDLEDNGWRIGTQLGDS